MSILEPTGYAWWLAKEFGFTFEQFARWIAQAQGIEFEGNASDFVGRHGYELTDTQYDTLIQLIKDNVPTDYVERSRKHTALQSRLQSDPLLKAQRDGWGS
jgi:hypothetical protein